MHIPTCAHTSPHVHTRVHNPHACTHAVGPQMVALLIPLYISILANPLTSDLQALPKAHLEVHSYFLQQVTLIGPKHPEAFRSVMQASPALKQKLELAIRFNQTVAKTKGSLPAAKGIGRGGAQRVQQQQQPSIKLKMDFSNFK